MSDRIPTMQQRRAVIVLSVVLFAAAVVYDLGLQTVMRPYAVGGIYFHPWSSEDMMQTVSLRDLRNEPLQTLIYTHIQPPAFDLIRALLVQFWPGLSDQQALVHVDEALYLLWALVLGFLVALIFLWLAETSGMAVAIPSALLFMLHPASIFFATFLDATLLTAVLVLWIYYLLWRLKSAHTVSILTISAVFTILFLTRSIFQWPSILLITACLLLLRVPWRQVLIFFVLTGLICGLYVAKQRSLFGILWTSSFAGVNLSNSIGVGMGTAKYAAYLNDPSHPTSVTPEMPDVLTSKTKIGGQRNFNNIDYLHLNNLLLKRYQKQLLSMPAVDIGKSYLENALIFFKPTSTYSSQHVIVDRLPWTGIYNWVFSAPVLPVLLLLGLIVWAVKVLKSQPYVSGLAILLPGLYVLLVSILSDKGENMRFKFFLEPVMFVFIVSQLGALGRAAYTKFARGQSSS